MNDLDQHSMIRFARNLLKVLSISDSKIQRSKSHRFRQFAYVNLFTPIKLLIAFKLNSVSWNQKNYICQTSEQPRCGKWI